MCDLNTAEEQNDIQRPRSTGCELRLQDQKGPAAISGSSPAVIFGATNTMKEPTDELEAPGIVNGGPRLPDRYADSEVAKEDKGIKTATTVFKMPAPCISCKAPVTCDNERGAICAAYDILFSKGIKCKRCAAAATVDG
ncbi:hypothetical protein O988_01121 [Pseudogymnoascus sp. VKM F-3808]|nr:hypothetical protein O988_01121 [Pseudogymnoascus sp. VKM F-3808]